MKRFFDLVDFITECANKENDPRGLLEAVKDNEKGLLKLFDELYKAKADFEHIKKFF